MRQKTAKKEAWRPKCAAPSLFYGSAPGRKIGGEMLRWRTFLAQHFPVYYVFSPRAVGVVRLAAPRFLGAAPIFRYKRKKLCGDFSERVCFAAGGKKIGVFFAKICLLIAFLTCL